MALPEAETNAAVTPMIVSDCTCCDYCAYCDGMEQQGEIDGVLHGRGCPWMAKRIAAGLPMKDERFYNHKFVDDPGVVEIMRRLAARKAGE